MNMKANDKFENYPIWMVILSNLVSLAIYGLGFFIIWGLGWVFACLYVLYIFVLEYRLIKNHCTNCYYWGKTCGFGKGRLSSWAFKKGNQSKFCTMDISWKSMIPDLLVSLIPTIIGVILLFIEFDLILLFALLLLIVLSTTGNAFIRGAFTCKYCKQRDLGCPAEQLFNKK